MKKTIVLLLFIAVNYSLLLAQTTQVKYPTPEFSNEIYFFDKDGSKAVRLEKGYSKQETQSKMGGMGGTNMGYTLEGSKSDVRIPAGNVSFIFYTGEAPANTEAADSTMRANGIAIIETIHHIHHIVFTTCTSCTTCTVNLCTYKDCGLCTKHQGKKFCYVYRHQLSELNIIQVHCA